MHTSKAEAELQAALDCITDINEDRKSLRKMGRSLFHPVFAHPLDDLIRKQGLGPGDNRAYARMHPDAFPRMVRSFKDSVLKRSAAEQPF